MKATISPTRRAILGAAAAAAVATVIGAPALAQPPSVSPAMTAALAAHAAATAKLEAHADAIFNPAEAAYFAVKPVISSDCDQDQRLAAFAKARAESGLAAAEKVRDRLLDAHSATMAAIIQFPCSHIGDLLAKVEFLQANDCWDFAEAPSHMSADIRRIGGVA